MVRIRFRYIAVFFLFLMLFCASAVAQYGNKNEISLEEASEYVRNTSNGKVISAKTSVVRGKKSYRIQVLTPSGRVKVYHIDAQKQSRNNSSGNRYNTQRNNSGYDNYRYRDPDMSANSSGYNYNETPAPRNNNSTQRRSRQK